MINSVLFNENAKENGITMDELIGLVQFKQHMEQRKKDTENKIDDLDVLYLGNCVRH